MSSVVSTARPCAERLKRPADHNPPPPHPPVAFAPRLFMSPWTHRGLNVGISEGCFTSHSNALELLRYYVTTRLSA